MTTRVTCDLIPPQMLSPHDSNTSAETWPKHAPCSDTRLSWTSGDGLRFEVMFSDELHSMSAAEVSQGCTLGMGLLIHCHPVLQGQHILAGLH